MFTQGHHGENDIGEIYPASTVYLSNSHNSALRYNPPMKKTGNNILSTRLDDLLKKQGFSDRGACLKAGVHIDTIRNIRNGSMPSGDRLDKLAKLVGVSSAYLLGNTDNPGGPDEEDFVNIDRLSLCIEKVEAILKKGNVPFSSEVRAEIAARLYAYPAAKAPEEIEERALQLILRKLSDNQDRP
jgi:transcriptional regulator with XRE-family HTH domain